MSKANKSGRKTKRDIHKGSTRPAGSKLARKAANNKLVGKGLTFLVKYMPHKLNFNTIAK